MCCSLYNVKQVKWGELAEVKEIKEGRLWEPTVRATERKMDRRSDFKMTSGLLKVRKSQKRCFKSLQSGRRWSQLWTGRISCSFELQQIWRNFSPQMLCWISFEEDTLCSLSSFHDIPISLILLARCYQWRHGWEGPTSLVLWWNASLMLDQRKDLTSPF